ncbi:MAG: hypothetical protein GF364_17500 [Candidatus Lokiarchaeota archaeon]|nr:hypothetical protein [Candidatus Lokiarchaeota archaeon]
MKFSFSSSDKIVDLPEEICPYLHDINRMIQSQIGFENIYTIILFGSYAREDHTKNSDIDLLIVIKDQFFSEHSKSFREKLEKISLGIELKHGLKFQRTGYITAVLNVVEKTTGMFVSHFICSKSDWENQIFHKIFNVNHFLSSLIAPGDIVLKNMSKSYMILYKEQKTPDIKQSISFIQLLKSLIMTELIAVGSIVIFPLWNNIVKYSLESFKWSIRNSYLYLFDKHASMKSMRNFFTKTAISQGFFDKFLRLRHKFERDVKFALRCPFEIIKTYFAAIRYKKVIRRNT